MSRLRLLAAAALLASLAGCGPAHEIDSLLIAGSSTYLRHSKALAAEFMKRHPRLEVICQGGGSFAGLIAVKRGAINIAAMSRDMDDEQDSDAVRSYVVARDGIGIVVHPSNPVSDLTVDQVRDVLSGRIKRWSQLGGRDEPIAVVGRDSASTTREGIENLVLRGVDMRRDAVIASESDDMLKKIASTPNAVGYLSTHEERPGVKVLLIEGVPLSRVTVLSERYPLSRSFYFVVSARVSDDEADAVVQKRINALTDEFLRFTLSPEGQDVLEKEGLFRVR